MSQARAPLFTEGSAGRAGFTEIESPGKVFLLGEYAVLAGEPALVAAVGPRFSLEPGASGDGIAPASPAGRLLALARSQGLVAGDFSFGDPHEGTGGFGASTAQFALVYQAVSLGNGVPSGWEPRWERVWSVYRELTAGAALAPSGADLVAQWKGGVIVFHPELRRVMDVTALLDASGLLVFSATGQAGRKTATHEHLGELSRRGGLEPDSLTIGRLRAPLSAGLEALRQGSPGDFGRALTAYAEALSQAGLEDERARRDRQALSSLGGVAGVKGTGALLSDGIVVQLEPRASPAERSLVLETAAARGLRLVSDGLVPEMGVTCR